MVRGVALVMLVAGCGAGQIDGPLDEEAPDAAVAAEPDAAPRPDAFVQPDATPGGCPPDMLPVNGACMDVWEAPNVAGEVPLVMYDLPEGEAWCGARGKRLCFDDEWQHACEGASGWPMPYGPTRVPGECNDDKVWRLYVQSKLDKWPQTAATPEMETLDQLLDRARSMGTSGQIAADHILELYQGEAGGENPACAGAAGVQDLVGNVEEWTRRRDGGDGPSFHGKLKGRYWAESRTCQNGVTTHGDGFRFYEIGFRCCKDL